MTIMIKSVLLAVLLSGLILPAYAQQHHHRHWDGRGYHWHHHHHHYCHQHKHWVHGHWERHHGSKVWVPGHWVWVRWCR